MSHLSLDARAILEYLNELGYRNISAEQLKEFLKDLRKLIKYEERLGINANQDDYFQTLFRRTTASYRAKVDKENGQALVKETSSKREGTKQAGAMKTRNVLHERNYEHEIGNDSQKQKSNLRSRRGRNNHTLSNTSDEENNGQANSRAYRLQQGDTINNLRRDFMENLKIYSPGQKKKATMGAEIRRECADNSQAQRESTQGKRLSERAAGSSETAGPRGNQTSAGFTEPASGKSKNLRKVTILPNVEGRRAKTGPQSAHNQKASSLCSTRQSRSVSPTISTKTAGTMISRCVTTARRRRPLRNDPVALYHYYQSEWRHFRKQIPGDNSHTNLRWEIRHKLLDPDCLPRQGEL